MKFVYPGIGEFNMNSSVDLSMKKALKTPPTRRTAEVKTPTEILYHYRYIYIYIETQITSSECQ